MATNETEPLDKQSQLDQVEKDYRQIKRMLLVGLIAIIGLAAVLLITQPGGYLPMVIFLVLVEAISYPLFSKSLDKRRVERIAEIESNG